MWEEELESFTLSDITNFSLYDTEIVMTMICMMPTNNTMDNFEY